MLVTTNAIVLQTIPYGETAVIAKVFTQHHGLLSFMVHSVRKRNARNSPSLFAACSLVQCTYHFHANKQLQYINSISMHTATSSIQDNAVKSCLAFFLAEMSVKSIKHEEADDELFNFLWQAIEYLNHCEQSVKQYHHYILIQLSKLLGFAPHGSYSVATPIFNMREGIFQATIPPYPESIDGQVAQLFTAFAAATFISHHAISSSADDRKALLQAILFYFDLHVLHGSKINSLEVLIDVMNA